MAYGQPECEAARMLKYARVIRSRSCVRDYEVLPTALIALTASILTIGVAAARLLTTLVTGLLAAAIVSVLFHKVMYVWLYDLWYKSKRALEGAVTGWIRSNA